MRVSIEALARDLNPIIRGVMNYYGKFGTYHTTPLWNQVNKRLLKWVKLGDGILQAGSSALVEDEVP